MDKEPLVTVVIPVYNRPIIVKTIESLINQTYKNLEILVIDNHSTDNTVQAIQDIQDSRIRVLINETNQGQTYSMNRGLKEANGKYIARIDSDDIAVEDRIFRQVEYMEANPDCVICGSWVRAIDEKDTLGGIIECCETDDAIRTSMVFYCPFFHPAVLMRRNTLVDNNLLYDREYHLAEDYELWTRLLNYGKGHNIPVVLTYYRQGNNNDSKIHEIKMYRESLSIQKQERMKIQDENWRQRMLGICDIESEEKLSIMKAFVLVKTYVSYIHSYRPNNIRDYKSIKKQIFIRIYGALVQTRDTVMARLVRKIVKGVKS